MKQQPTLRTTFKQIGEIQLPHAGVYILAYLGKVIYVGKAESSIEDRLYSHVRCAQCNNEQLGKWLVLNNDHINIRLDILAKPYNAPNNWCVEIEAKCIQRFNPLLNERLN